MTTRTSIKVDAQPGTPFVDTEREFEAPRDLVFRAWTEPELVRQWLGPKQYEMLIDEWSFREGGRYRYLHRAPDGGEHGFHGVFHSTTPDNMVQTFEYEGAPGHVSLDRLELVDLGGGRTLARTHTVFQSVEARDAMVAGGMTDGMNQGYERLDALLGRLATA
jgi:uncharacterized protein YndB with AHSA1/START domain